MIGRTIAHYEILGQLGKGGMGEVYRALDRKLDRQVALKILPAELAEDPRLIGRFEREAKTVAALNHPNIVTLHSVEEVDGVHFLTMELIEGKSLDQKVPKGGLGLDRFFELALPLTEAVAAAHEAGVTHRDLKPANVMVADDGRLKVLDFGLAKLLEPSEDTITVDAPTEALTREGLVVGTLPYMSPEQVQGETVDARSDIFSLGIILYEMLAGRRPFAGRSSAEAISALLRDTPAPVDELKPGTPHQLARVIRRCLEKDPARRYQSARDLMLELQDLQRDLASDAHRAAATSQQPARAQRALKVVLAVVVVLVVAALIREWATRPAEPTQTNEARTPVRLAKLTGAPGLEDEPAWSPDGRFMAYTTGERGNLDIVIQPLGGGQLIRAFEDPADEASPAWSPDGRRIAFVSARDRDGRLSPGIGRGALTSYLITRGGDLMVAPAFGGPALKVADDAYTPSWSPDGERIAYVGPEDDRWAVWTVDAEGGDRKQLNPSHNVFDPAWSPDGTRIAYGAIDILTGSYSLRVIAADGGTPSVLELPQLTQAMGPAWSQDSESVFFSSNLSGRYNLWRVRAPEGENDSFGEPQQITFGGGADVGVSVNPTTGQLAFATVSTDVNLWELDLATRAVRQLTTETGVEINAQASPDGKTLLVATDRGGVPEIWTYSVDGEPLQRVGPAPNVDFTGLWSPDGERIAYTRGGPEGLEGIFLKQRGSIAETPLLLNANAGEWSPDGRELLAARIRSEDSRFTDIVSIDIRDGSVRRLTFIDGLHQFMTWSPDGREIIFNSQTGGTRKLWQMPAAGGEPEPLTFGSSEDSHPRWSRTDPEAVVYLRNHATLCIIDPTTGEIRELAADIGPHFGLDYPSWSADGTRIYFSAASKTGDIFVTEE